MYFQEEPKLELKYKPLKISTMRHKADNNFNYISLVVQ